MRTRRLLFEALEPRLCLAAPPLPYPGTPLSLPQGGAWTQTPFVASPLFADLRGDGKQELIAAAAGGKLIAYTVDNGTPHVFKEYDSFPMANGVQGNIKATPVVITLPNGRKAIFAGLGRDEAHAGAVEDGRIFGWDALTGQILPGWPQSSGYNVNGEASFVGPESGVIGPLASGALEGNGVTDIVVTSFSHFVTAFRPDGSTIWRYDAADTIEGGAVVGDVDRDGKPEVVVGSDSSASQFREDQSTVTNYINGGWINILEGATGSAKYRHLVTGEAIWSSPVLADLYGNGYLDIIVGTGITYAAEAQYPGSRAAGNIVMALDYQGHMLPGWPYHTDVNDNNTQYRESVSAPAVVDLFGDGHLEVIEADRGGFVHVIDRFGRALPGWSGGRTIFPPNYSPDFTYSTPIVADADGNGTPDIIAVSYAFATAFDARGNVLWQISPGSGRNSTVNSPAVGRFDGQAGLQLAFVSNVAGVPNKPDLVSIYQLPASPLVPPWPMQRETASGQPVVESTAFVNNYVAHVFGAILGRAPDAAGFQYFVNNLLTNQMTPTQVVQTLANSTEGQFRTVGLLFNRFLGRNADPGGLNYFFNYLASRHTVQDAAVTLITTPEFARLAGRTPQGIIRRIYQTAFGRTPSANDVNVWASRLQHGTPLAVVARQLLTTDEGIFDTVGPIYGIGLPRVAIPPDAFYAIAADLRHNRRQEDVFANILASGGNYAATDLTASWVRSVYRDVLHRDGSSSEVASVLKQFNANRSSPLPFVQGLLNSGEARARFVADEYQTLLGHGPDAGGLASLVHYAHRSDVIVALVSSDEYFRRNGGSVDSYVAAAYRDIADISPVPGGDAAGWVQRINGGQSRSVLAATLAASPSHGFKVAIADLFKLIPDESLGVLRTGEGVASQAQVINPNPGLVNYAAGLIQSGGQERELATLLTSPQYFARAAYSKGFYVARNIRS